MVQTPDSERGYFSVWMSSPLCAACNTFFKKVHNYLMFLRVLAAHLTQNSIISYFILNLPPLKSEHNSHDLWSLRSPSLTLTSKEA